MLNEIHTIKACIINDIIAEEAVKINIEYMIN